MNYVVVFLAREIDLLYGYIDIGYSYLDKIQKKKRKRVERDIFFDDSVTSVFVGVDTGRGFLFKYTCCHIRGQFVFFMAMIVRIRLSKVIKLS